MAWTVDMFDADHDVQTNMGAIEGNINHLKDNHASTLEPSNLSAGQWWYDTTAGILKLRNAANDAWQYVWDFTNNQPMGSIIIRGTAVYSGNMLLDAVTLSRGSNDKRVALTAFDFVYNSGAPISKSAVTDGIALGSSSIPSDRCGAYLLSIDADGDITVTPAADNYTTGYLTMAAAKTAGNLIATPGGTTRIGYLAVASASGHTFREDTDALEGGSSGYPSSDTDYVPDSPANTMAANVTPDLSAYAVGVYYIKATYRNYLTTPTLNLDALGAKSIKGPDGETLGTGGVIIDGHHMILYYDGTDFLLLNPLSPDHGMEAFTTGGTFTKPQGISKVFVRVWGGGGGGGNHYSGSPRYLGGNGGYGGYAEGWIDITTDVTVTVGGGGAAGADGGDSSFAGSTTIQATGGKKGVNATSGGAGANGANGTGSNGTLNARIDWPSLNGAFIYAAADYIGGAYVLMSRAKTNYGVGGAGGYYDGSNPVSGAAGTQGIVLIYW